VSLIVEDGSIVAGAESYIDATYADTYHSNRGNTAWTGSSLVKEAALRRATDYMQQAYRNRWKGFRTNAALQALDWPRQNVLIDDSVLNAWIDLHTIPMEVKNAQAELALKALSSTLAPDLDRATLMEKVGEITVQYDNKAAPQYVRYRAIDLMLKQYLTATGAMAPLVRT
jgi:hypothetical protein